MPLRDADQVYKVDIETITALVKQEFAAKQLTRRAVVGSIIGAIAGGGEGAAIGAGVGAAAGAGSEIITRGDQVRVPSETFIEFTLQLDVSMPKPGN